MTDWSQCSAVESDPGKVHGAWVLKDTRLPVTLIFECLARGASVADIVDWYGGVTPEQVEAVITFVADTVENPAHANPV